MTDTILTDPAGYKFPVIRARRNSMKELVQLETTSRFIRLEVNVMNSNPELLVGLSVAELEALADSSLAPAAQHRLDELLARSKENKLVAGEELALVHLPQKVDNLTIVKTRARLTLDQQRAEVTAK
jgi:hypothetical protein